MTLTLLRTATGETTDLALSYVHGSTWEDLPAGAASGGPWWCGATELDAAARLGTPPLLDGALLTDRPVATPASTALDLCVCTGPDAGRRVPLSLSGEVAVGRGPENDLVVADRAMSRRHVTVSLHHDEVTVTPVAATNPPLLGGRPVLAPLRGRAGDVIELGESRLEVRRRTRTVTEPEIEAGRVLVRPTTVRWPPLPVVRVRRPAPPPELPRRRLPLLMILGPVAMSVALAWMLHSPMALALGALTPVMLLLQHLTERREGRTGTRRAHAEYARAGAEAQRRLDDARERESRELRRRHPDLAAVTAAAATRGELLWSRGCPGDVCLGRGEVESHIVVQDGDAAVLTPEPLHDAPVTVPCVPGETLWIRGEPTLAEAVARAVLLRLATLAPPPALSLDEHDLTRWLPHGSTPAGLHVALDRAPGEREWALRWASREAGADGGPSWVVDLAARTITAPDGVARRLVADGVAADTYETAARALRPCCVPAHGSGVVAGAADLAGVLGDLDDVAAALDRWAAPHDDLAVPLGAGASGDVQVDLVAHGPHALVGGTTGAGKSELLQSWVALLAAREPPDRLTFVLVDYKGGAAFRDCARLPHTAGLVTDLDEHEATRALTSLRSEISRRERLLAELGAKDRDEALRVARSRAGEIPRLVIVIDEFRALAEELPELVTGLVRIAALGRSLGVHLVLATQRPAGVVSPEIRANASLRIALRMRDEADSRDVLDDGAAAAIPGTSPGRFLVRHDASAPLPAQARYGGGPLPPRGRRVVVEGLPTDAAGDGRRQLSALVDTLRAAADRLGLPRPPSPWPPSLPEAPRRPGYTGPGLAFAVQDTGAGRELGPLAWDADQDPHVMLVGGPRSGRTTALATLACAAADRGWDVHALDSSGALRQMLRPDLDGRLGTFVSRDAPDLVRPLLTEIAHGPRPRLLLADDLPSWLTDLETYDQGRSGDALQAALRDGPRQGLHLAVSGDRSLLTGRLGQHVPLRFGLRQADRADWSLLGVESRRAPGAIPPGRLLVPPSGMGHVYLPDPPARHASRGAPRLVPLPASLPAPVEGRPAVGGPFAAPLYLHDADGEILLTIVGGSRSGKTTALATVGATLGRPVVAVTPSARVPAVWTEAGLARVVVRGDAVRLADEIHATPDAVVLVDDLERVLGTDCEQVLLQRLQHARENACGGVVAAGSATDLAVAYRGLAMELRRERRGVLLNPERPGDGEFFASRVVPLLRPAPGRGYLMGDGQPVPVQLALPAQQDARPRTGT